MNDQSTATGAAAAPGRHRARLTRTRRWVVRRIRRKLRWVLAGLAIIYLVGALGATQGCDHELEQRPTAVTTTVD